MSEAKAMKGSELRAILLDALDMVKKGYISDLLCSTELVVQELEHKVVVSESWLSELASHLSNLVKCENCGLLCDWNGCPNKNILKELDELMRKEAVT